MQKSFSKNSNNRLNLLGIYQIIGGAAGILLTIWLLARTGQITGLIALLFFLAFLLYGFSVCCGILLFGKHYKIGLSLSIINQALQIISFEFLGYAYLYVSGLMLNLGIGYGVGELSSGFKFGFNFGLISKWQFSIASDNHSFSLYFNLVAIYVIYYIDKLRQSVKIEQLNSYQDDPDGTPAHLF